MDINGNERRERGRVGRPKRYRYHEDKGGLVIDPDALPRLLRWVDEHASPDVRAKFSDPMLRRSMLEKPNFYPVSPITFNDPRCCLMAVEACLRSQSQTYIRAIDLCNRLKDQHPTWFFDVTVMGRILAGIRQACEEAYRNANAFVEDVGDLPFAMGRDGRGRYYVIDPLGGNEGRVWLWFLRLRLHERATRQQFSDLIGDFRRYHARDNNAGWLSEIAPDPIRSKEAYEGQLGTYAGADFVPGEFRPLPPAPDFERMRDENARLMREREVAEGFRPAGEQP